MTANQLRYWELQETKRSNLAREHETRRANRANEKLTRAYQAGTLDLRAQELAENVRRNMASESISLATLGETARHNLAYEQESARHNLATEKLTSRQLDISQATLAETTRSHKAQESLSYANLSELTRHNQAQEGLTARQLDIDSQYKQEMASQGMMRITLDTQHIESEKRRVVNETYSRIEAARHNKEVEAIQKEQNELRGYELIMKGLDTGVKVGSALAMAMA